MPATRPIVNEFAWDAARQRYRRAGRFVSERAVKLAIRRTIRAAGDEIRALGRDVAAGRMTVGDWQSRMAGEIRNLHLAAAMAARGGRRNMTPADWLRAGREIRYQLGRLARFARDVAAARLTPRRVEARAAMYADAADATFENARRGAAAGRFARERNVLGPTENHCGGCLAETARGWVGIGELVPIGGRPCMVRCACRYEFDNPPYTGRVILRGSKEELATAARLIGLGVEKPAAIAAIGVPTDAVFKEVHVRVGGAGTIYIEAIAPGGGVVERSIRREDGDIVLSNNSLTLPESVRGRGEGIRHFAAQVAHARGAGVTRIETYAARGEGYNGYYTWPRAGYDGPIPGAMLDRARAEVRPGVRRLSDLMATPAGRDWWRTNGDSVGLTFDLRPGSLSNRMLGTYLTPKPAGR